jgi:hypothetical protein
MKLSSGYRKFLLSPALCCLNTTDQWRHSYREGRGERKWEKRKRENGLWHTMMLAIIMQFLNLSKASNSCLKMTWLFS